MKNIFAILILFSTSLPSFSQQTSNDTIHWSAAKKLEWKDFAKSAGKTSLMSQATMLMNAKFHKGIKSRITIETIFDRKFSFVAADKKNAQELKYYQIMFNLYEVESRKLRKTLKETKLGLDPEKVFLEKYQASLKTLEERVDSYQEETEDGTNATELEKWSKSIEAELTSLQAYTEKASAGKK